MGIRDRDTPLRLVRKWAKMAPGCYETLDRCYDAKIKGEMQWPDWCELPMAAAYTYLVANQGLSEEQAALGAAELTACWTWRRSKVLYAYDADLAEALMEQAADMADSETLPAELLLHLPYPCIYIKAPGITEHIDGFWIFLEHDLNRPDTPELRIQLVAFDMDYSFPMVIHLVPGGTILDCIRSTNTVIQSNGAAEEDTARGVEDIQIILRAIQLLLYLVSEQADVEERPSPVKAVRKNRGGAAIVQDKASEVKSMDVGIRIGAALRAGSRPRYTSDSVSVGTGSAKRPHTRRGHWHHYWAGPRDDRRLILKWTAPTVIHPEAGEAENVVMFPVKGPGRKED